jgi:Uri superfamily endonuclease
MLRGIYALIIQLDRDITIQVGAIDKTDFKKGRYVYVGSAQANLEQRVRRHLRKNKRLFWHIDYLLESDAAKVSEVLYMQGDKAAECAVAKEISSRGEAVSGFGCSDCRCKSHLFRVADDSFLQAKMQPLKVQAYNFSC